MSKDFTQAILEMLEVFRKKEVATKQPFKAKAYANVIKNISLFGKPIASMDDLKDVKGIGEKIGQKIEELINTGKVQAMENASKDENTEIITSLMTIHGIGPAKAKTLVEQHGIKSIDDLRKKSELLNDKQLLGLKYVNDFQLRIPRKEMDAHCELLSTCITSIDKSFEFQLTGSYRRMAPSSGDIDILITHKDDPENVEELFKSVIDKLKKEGYITDVFAEGGKKCLAVCRLKRHKYYRRIDLLYTNKKEYPFAVLYFTGDAGFNVAMRSYCLTKGLSLSEHGMKDEKTGTFIDIGAQSEKDIFAYLGLEYVEPKDRKVNAIKVIA
jgi:DNA polymerase/3'-5' exonuclease PolX